MSKSKETASIFDIQGETPPANSTPLSPPKIGGHVKTDFEPETLLQKRITVGTLSPSLSKEEFKKIKKALGRLPDVSNVASKSLVGVEIGLVVDGKLEWGNIFKNGRYFYFNPERNEIGVPGWKFTSPKAVKLKASDALPNRPAGTPATYVSPASDDHAGEEDDEDSEGGEE